tara:strand:- start:731 stop:934 length:204 start_codon:yes stop_codon:yes gene_type:complete
MNEFFLVEHGMSLSMETRDQLDDVLSKNEPYLIEIYQPDGTGTYRKHEVNNREELETLMNVWSYYEI